MKVLRMLDSFYLNGHTPGFHLQTWKLEPPCTTEQTVPQECIAQQLSFVWSHAKAQQSSWQTSTGGNKVHYEITVLLLHATPLKRARKPSHIPIPRVTICSYRNKQWWNELQRDLKSTHWEKIVISYISPVTAINWLDTVCKIKI